MRLISRVVRFSGVGLLSTFVHFFVLACLLYLSLPVWLANLVAFTFAFIASFLLQQNLTFADRLGGARMNLFAATTLFSLNLVCAGVLGQISGTRFALFLPLAPAILNFTALYIMSGNSMFRRRA